MEKISGIVLTEESRSDNYTFYVGAWTENLMKKNAVTQINIVKHIDFRLNAKVPHESLLIYDINPTLPCIGLDRVRTQYGELSSLPPIPPPMLTPGQPMIENPEFIDQFESTQPWGSLSFSFVSKDPKKVGCLTSINFGFNKQ